MSALEKQQVVVEVSFADRLGRGHAHRPHDVVGFAVVRVIICSIAACPLTTFPENRILPASPTAHA